MIVMITNTIVPYCYDIAHILALPTDFPHRFRYLDKYIKLPSSIKDAKGHKALIVLRNNKTADLIPIRCVLIEEILKVGEINYIEFRTQEYFPIEKKHATCTAIDEGILKRGYRNEGGEFLECLVLDVQLPGLNIIRVVRIAKTV